MGTQADGPPPGGEQPADTLRQGECKATSPGPRLRPFPNYGHLNVLDSCLENLHL